MPASTGKRYLRTADGGNVVRHHTLPFVAIVVDGVHVVMGLARAQILAELPEQIRGHAWGRQSRLLPRQLVGAVVALHTVFLKEAGLANGFTDGGMVLYPVVAP